MSPLMRKRYEDHFRNRELNAHNASGEGVKDFSGPLEKGVGREKIDAAVKAGAVDKQGHAIEAAKGQTSAGNYAQAGQMALQASQADNGLSGTGGMLMAAGAIPSPASPWLIGAGLGLSVLGQGEANKRKEEEAQRQAYNERIQRRQELMGQIANMGIA